MTDATTKTCAAVDDALIDLHHVRKLAALLLDGTHSNEALAAAIVLLAERAANRLFPIIDQPEAAA